MQQIELIKTLKLKFSNTRLKNYRQSFYRSNNGIYCYRLQNHFINCRNVLISELDSLINENDIDLANLKHYGLLRCIKTEKYIEFNMYFLENYLESNFKLKTETIDKMLDAINLIDECINSNNL